jgi:hypothetical protein
MARPTRIQVWLAARVTSLPRRAPDRPAGWHPVGPGQSARGRRAGLRRGGLRGATASRIRPSGRPGMGSPRSRRGLHSPPCQTLRDHATAPGEAALAACLCASGVHGQAEASPAPPRPANTPEPPPSATLPTPTPANPPSQPTQPTHPAPPARTRHTGPFDLLTYRENDTGRQDGIPALPAEAFAAASWAGDRQATPLFGGPFDRVVFGLPQPKGQHAGPIRPADGATEQDLTAQRDGLERSESGGTTMLAQAHGRWDHHDPARSWIRWQGDGPGPAQAGEGCPPLGLA